MICLHRIEEIEHPRSSSSVNEHRNLRRPGTAPMRIKQTQTFYAYENVGDEKNDDSGFIESDVDSVDFNELYRNVTRFIVHISV